MVFGLEILIGAALAAVLVGGCIGYWIALSNQKRASGGKTLAEMHSEKEAYQEGVAEHFKTTAMLLHEMTEKYREVYRHMADGAQTLVTSEVAAPALAQLRGDLIAAEAHQVEPTAAVAEATSTTSDESMEVPQEETVVELDSSETLAEVADEQTEITAPIDDESHSIDEQSSSGFFAEESSSTEPLPTSVADEDVDAAENASGESRSLNA